MTGSMGERSGHPEIAWTILLEATVAGEVPATAVRERLAAAWPAGLGPPPDVVEAGGPLSDVAATAFPPGGPRCRVQVVPGSPTGLVVVADHGALDGLGLVGVLGAALGVGLGTTARGVPAGSAAAPRGGTGYAARRLAEALLRPPARIAPALPGDEPGEHLVRETVRGRVGTAVLVAAAARAVRRWNARAGLPAPRVVVAVGASTRPGASPGIGRQAAWFRLRVDDPSADAVAAALRAATPEPEPSASVMRAARRTGVARAIAGRTGSTLLVSNLGGLAGDGSDRVVDAAFYPAAHGRSGVSVGSVGVGERTVLTLRARRRDLPRDRALELVRAIASEVEPPGPA